MVGSMSGLELYGWGDRLVFAQETLGDDSVILRIAMRNALTKEILVEGKVLLPIDFMFKPLPPSERRAFVLHTAQFLLEMVNRERLGTFE